MENSGGYASQPENKVKAKKSPTSPLGAAASSSSSSTHSDEEEEYKNEKEPMDQTPPSEKRASDRGDDIGWLFRLITEKRRPHPILNDDDEDSIPRLIAQKRASRIRIENRDDEDWNPRLTVHKRSRSKAVAVNEITLSESLCSMLIEHHNDREKLESEWIPSLNESYKVAPIPESKFCYYFSPEDEDMDPLLYFEKRLKTLASHKAQGKNPYSHSFTVSLSIPEYIEKYGSLKPDQHMDSVIECLSGRVMNKLSSSEVITYDLVGFGGQVQVMAYSDLSDMDFDDFRKCHSDLKYGDYIGIIGFPGKSCMGELSIILKSIVILSCCLHKMPPTYPSVKNIDVWSPGTVRYPDAYTINHQETRYNRRFLDLTINSEVKDIFIFRTKVISYTRHFLENLGFLEVETPTLTMVPGGAATRRFVTYNDDLNKQMFLRSAPELYLKQLVVGGIERVFEIGKQFRNEGIDLIHNPEFTTCEFCMALADYKDLMELTEQMLSGMVKELTGGYKVTYHANGYENNPVEIDFTPPFRRIFMIEELEKMANLSLPKDLASDEARQYLADACTKFNIKCPPPQTTARLLDKLVGHFLEVTCVNPTFVIDLPEITSPLAKAHECKPGLTERFILFVNKLELVNGYTVENEPVIQRQRFSKQVKDRQSGVGESMALDETFCMALEYGIPPSAGWVLGIDRLTMLLTDSQNIKEVILFPTMKPQPHYELPPIKVMSAVSGVEGKRQGFGTGALVMVSVVILVGLFGIQRFGTRYI